jgi:hypothetical protein
MTQVNFWVNEDASGCEFYLTKLSLLHYITQNLVTSEIFYMFN